MAKTPRAPANMSFLTTGRKFLEATRTPSPAALSLGGLFPGVSISDTTPPSVPQNLQATAISTSQINLSWSASTDTGGAGLAGYRVYRNGSNTALGPTFTGTTYSDTGLSASTAYTYRVTAVDNVGNESAQSSQAVATTQAATSSVFPLSITAGERFLRDKNGNPWFMQGTTPWSLAVQRTTSEITQFLANTAQKGFNTILFNAIEHYYTSQTPEYLNVAGQAPFTTMTDFASAFNESYWSVVDHIVNECLRLNIFCVINPAYLGYSGTEEGWDTEVGAESDADLRTYGTRLAQRYPQPNVGWSLGGDQTPGTTLRNKQAQILTGIRSVSTAYIVTAHAAPQTPSYPTWGSVTGVNLHTAYAETAEVFAQCLTEFTRTQAPPFVMIEAIYEQERSPAISAAGLRRQSYQAICAGAKGQFFGNNPEWHQESFRRPYSYTGTWITNQDSTGRQQQAYVKQLIDSIRWWTLEPKTGTELVTTAQGSGDTRICPALASDGQQALIWRTSAGSVTVNMAAMSIPSVRARFYDPTTGTFSTVSGSPFPASGTRSIAWPGERMLVLDADPSAAIAHGQVFTVTGSGFGSKSSNSLIWDNCSHGQSISTRWNGMWPTTAGTGSNMNYRTPAALGRGVATPHSNVTAYACGCHLKVNDTDGGNNVALWRTFNKAAFPFWVVYSYYERVDPAFDQQNSDNNFKWFGYGAGGSIYPLPNNWYIEYYDPWLDSTNNPLGTHSFDDTSGAGFQAHASIYGGIKQPNPKPAWIKKDVVVKLTDISGQGALFTRANNVVMMNQATLGYTDKYAGTQRSVGIGGYARGRGANNWRYFADIYSDLGPNPGRFYLTNNATFNSATIAEPQPWTSWADDQVTLTCNKGQLPSGTVHVHFRNEAGTPQYLGTLQLQ